MKHRLFMFTFLFFAGTANALEAVMTAGDGSEVIIMKTNQCRDLDVGDRQQVSIPWDQSPTTVQSFYTLTRTGEKNYVINLNVMFTAKPEYDGDRGGITSRGSDLDDYVDKIYREKMRTCFNKYKGKLSNASGEVLDFELGADSLDRTRITRYAERVYIDINNATHRSDSIDYSSTIDCETMIHETMHLLGLTDEYQETSTHVLTDVEAKNRGFDPTHTIAYDCRKVGPPDSLMANQWKALAQTMFEYDQLLCFCDLHKNKACKKPIQTGTTCPRGTKQHFPPRHFINTEDEIQKTHDDAQLSSVLLVVSNKHQLPHNPPLSVEQTNVILHPECDKINGFYYECAKDAYSTSTEHGGKGCKAPLTCRSDSNKSGSTDERDKK